MVAISLLYRFADFVTLLGGTEFHLGWIVGVGMLGSLAMRCMMGAGIDQYGARLVWLWSTVVLVLCCFAHLALTSCQTPSIYLLRILYCSSMAGFFGASVTFVCNRVPAGRIAEMVGMIGTAGFLGAVLGTSWGDLMLGSATIARRQIDQMFVMAGLLCVAAFALVYAATRGEPRPAPRARLPVLRLLRQYQPGAVLILVGVAMGASLNLPATFMAPYTAEIGVPRIGVFFGVYAVAAVLTRVLTRRWLQRIGLERLVLLGIGGVVISQLLLLLVHAEWHLLLPGIGYGMSHAILFPAAVAAGMRKFPDYHRGLGNTLMLATWDVGQLLGAPAAGVILRYSAPLGLPPYPVLFASTAGMMLLVGVLYAKTLRPGTCAGSCRETQAEGRTKHEVQSTTRQSPNPQSPIPNP